MINVSRAIYFIQKKGTPYAERLRQPKMKMDKRLKAYFSDCPVLSEKIGTTYTYKNIKSLEPILQEYNQSCK